MEKNNIYQYQIFKNDNILYSNMNQTKFYFYNISLKDINDDYKFNWEESLNQILNETKIKAPTYINHSDYTLSIYVLKKENLDDGRLYSGYILVGEDDEDYKKEKKGDFFELGFEDDEHLLHALKGKLYFLSYINDEGKNILMLEKQYFSINIKGFLSYFKSRYSDKIQDIRSRTILGKDLISIITSLKDNKIKLVKLYFKKFTPEETIRTYGYVEDALISFLKKGIYAEIALHWEKPVGIVDFFKKLFKKNTFEEALDVDFGEFLKIFSFETDNDTIPSLNLLDQIISFTLPGDKADYNDNQIFSLIKKYLIDKKDKII